MMTTLLDEQDEADRYSLSLIGMKQGGLSSSGVDLGRKARSPLRDPKQENQ